MLIGFGAGSAQVNTIVRIYLQSGDKKELLQEFMATVETPDKAGIGPAMLGMDPRGRRWNNLSSSKLRCLVPHPKPGKRDIESLSDALAKAIVRSLVPFL